MSVTDLPAINATLNLIATLLLILGYRFIRRGNESAHRCTMLSAVIVSALFLISYVIYHYAVGSVPYPHHDWTRPVYFVILIPHVILAAVNAPFVLLLLYRALRGEFDKHKRLARFIWPIWLFVSFSGVVVYWMLYQM
jgi:uncharacterized membrane protein YozB (DUF420 family)